MELRRPRWKGKASEAMALSNPMSEIIRQLQLSLMQSNGLAFLSGCDVLLEAGEEQADLLNRACFGCSIDTVEKDKKLFQLDFEEALYLCYALKCVVLLGEDKQSMNCQEIWDFMKSKRKRFPDFYKAYSHLRSKNWVVRSGSLYGADFVVYHHHPVLVHSGYAAIVLTECNSNKDARLRVWSDWECMVRVSGSVAKTLLLIYVDNNVKDTSFPSCLKSYAVVERTITRWNPDHCREDYSVVKSGNCGAE